MTIEFPTEWLLALRANDLVISRASHEVVVRPAGDGDFERFEVVGEERGDRVVFDLDAPSVRWTGQAMDEDCPRAILRMLAEARDRAAAGLQPFVESPGVGSDWATSLAALCSEENEAENRSIEYWLTTAEIRALPMPSQEPCGCLAPPLKKSP